MAQLVVHNNLITRFNVRQVYMLLLSSEHIPLNCLSMKGFSTNCDENMVYLQKHRRFTALCRTPKESPSVDT